MFKALCCRGNNPEPAVLFLLNVLKEIHSLVIAKSSQSKLQELVYDILLTLEGGGVSESDAWRVQPRLRSEVGCVRGTRVCVCVCACVRACVCCMLLSFSS